MRSLLKLYLRKVLHTARRRVCTIGEPSTNKPFEKTFPDDGVSTDLTWSTAAEERNERRAIAAF